MSKTEQEIDKLLTDLASLSQSPVDAAAIAQIVRRLHRTNQQSIGRCLKAIVKVFSKAFDDHHYDLRNEATCKMCKEINNKVDEHSLPFI